jgi:predicted RNA-binding Zn-ribbon protein involved in translation (DUF1610 family)
VRANGGVCPDCGRTIPRDKEAERLHAEGLPEDHCQLRPDVADRL